MEVPWKNMLRAKQKQLIQPAGKKRPKKLRRSVSDGEYLWSSQAGTDPRSFWFSGSKAGPKHLLVKKPHRPCCCAAGVGIKAFDSLQLQTQTSPTGLGRL